ncbi:DUF5682 family protein [Roseateles amylovorans]|uniref:DUF5682 family protein n=1 Tax=Roseateles amylovorans TaxID=2978473 RepID=A0ABY6B3E0_9BURK|nr:DUF5682 family protein [Roseateles amylovorans]UXH79444.1 DUF5682 family protein [Roseateles amylovorans]
MTAPDQAPAEGAAEAPGSSRIDMPRIDMPRTDVPRGDLHFFGVRHHGPGCARSLLRALDSLRPDCVLIEGAPEADGLVADVLAPDMVPPVALLTHGVDDPECAVYHPFAEFSPEWQALRWAARAGVTVRFIDLPMAHSLALSKAEEAAASETAPRESQDQDQAQATELIDKAAGEAVGEGASTNDALPSSLEAPVPSDDTAPAPAAAEADRRGDPLDWLARAAGYADGEAWWNHMVEERGDGEELFAAIEEAMVTLRAELPDEGRLPERHLRREALREAYMRQCIRAARKDGFGTIAVICGAWHLGGLKAPATAKADQALLKGLPKLKVASTWVPWTYRHLALDSGYGAGIQSPGWYDHLWRSSEPRSDGQAPTPRAVGWLARVARLMRERSLDCSSAHLIEAARLADALAALRQRPAPGLEELHEATRTVMTMGDESVLSFIRDQLIIGDRLGQVPASVPKVPLQRDLEQWQKSLRLKPEASQKTLDLDLRQPNDLARSHLLHRLSLLGIRWGELAKVGRSSRGTFHEVWTLQWEPAFAIRLIETSRFGQTVAQAATARVAEQCRSERDLGTLAQWVDQVLLADLPEAVAVASQALQDHAAITGDADQLMAALPPLANVFRYGNVRGTDAALVGQVFDGLVVRAAIGLPLLGSAIDDSAAEVLRDRLLAAHAALKLRDPGRQAEPSQQWLRAIGLLADREGAHELLRGLCTRLMLDEALIAAEEAGNALSLHLSTGTEPLKAAAWLDGFLNRNAVVLLHHDGVWPLVDRWLAGLSEEHFVQVLPLVRRTFSRFDSGERRDLGTRAARQGGPTAAASAALNWDESRAQWPLPLLRQLLGVTR